MREIKFDELCVHFVLAGQILGRTSEPRIDVPEVLRIRNEKINVFAGAVVIAKHQDRTAAESPMGV